MSVIYTPKGKAREYSPLACNLYSGCNHGCKYCYAPAILRKKREDFLAISERRNIINSFKKEIQKTNGKQVLFCFTTDPYNEAEKVVETTKKCLIIALENKVPVVILTKSKLVLRDLEIFKKFEQNIRVGMTLTMDNDKDSKEWEKNASLPSERVNVLKILHDNNIQTWASFEPVIDPNQSLNMMKKSAKYVDLFRVGKLNNYKGLDKNIDWNKFLKDSVNFLRSKEKDFYIKDDLRKYARGFKLYGNETNCDEFNLSWQ